jgi:hypothetical protein
MHGQTVIKFDLHILNGTYCCQHRLCVTVCQSAASQSLMPDFSLHWIMFHLKCRFKPQHFPTFMWEMPVLNPDRRLSVSTDGIRDDSRHPYAKVWKTHLSRATTSSFHLLSNALLTTIVRSRQYVLGYWQHSSAPITGNVSSISGKLV